MSDAFDPYYEWLGIPPKDQPANHYRLLGIELFETNPNVIERSADRQMGHVRTFQNGKRSAESQQLLNELSAAKVSLLNEDKRVDYDEALRAELQAELAPATAPILPVPVAQAAAPPVRATSQPALDLHRDKKNAPPSVSTRRKRKSRSNRLLTQLAFVGTLLGVLAIGLIAAFVLGVFSVPEPIAKSRTESNSPAKQSKVQKKEETVPSKGPDTTKKTKSDPPSTGSTSVGEIVKVDESQATIEDADPDALASRTRSGLPANIAQSIYGGKGTFTRQFLLCQSLAHDEFTATLRPLAGYACRPLRIRPYVVDGDVRIAAVWTRDTRPWRFVTGLSADEWMAAHQRLTAAGFEPVDVAGFDDGAVRFAAVWVKSEGETPKSEVWLGLTSAEFNSRLNARSDTSLIAHSSHIFNHNGKHHYNIIWKPAPDGVSGAARFSGSQSAFEQRVKTEHRLLDIAIAGNAEHGHLVGGSMVLGATPTKQLHSLSPTQHLAKCRDMAARGLVPISISVASVKGSAAIAASVWEPATDTTVPATTSTTGTPAVTAADSYALRFEDRSSVMVANTRGLLDVNQRFTAEVWFRITKPPERLSALLGTGATRSHPSVTEPAMAGWLIAAGRAQNSNSSDAVAIRWSDVNKQVVGIQNNLSPLKNDWHHLAICNEPQPGGGWRADVYLDGVSRMRLNRKPTDVYPSPSDFFLGVSEFLTAQTTFYGDIRACRLSSEIRYTKNFKPDETFKSDESTLALLQFDGTDPDVIKDISGAQRHGKILGAKWVQANTSPTPQTTPNPGRMVAEVPPKRLAVPSASEREAASAKVKEIYRDEFDQAKDAIAKVKLATELLKQADETTEAASQFGLLFEARLLAIAAMNPHLALRMTDRIIEHFEVAPWTLKADTMVKLSESVKSPTDRRLIAELVLEMAEAAMLDNEYVAARKQVDLIARLNRPRDRDLGKAAIALGKQIDDGKKLWQSAEDAKLKLAESPDDPGANFNLGRYLCFVKEEWDAGLPHLAKGTLAKLKDIATKDLQEPADGKGRLAVADEWYDWAEKVSDVDRNGGLLRAQYWYKAALPGLADLDRTKANRRLSEIAERVVSNGKNTAKYAWLDVDVGLVKRLQGHTSEVRSLAVTRSGKYVVSGSRDQTVRFWDLAEGKETALLRPGVGEFARLGLSPDDRFVIVAGTSEIVEVWNLQTRKLADRLDTKLRSRAMATARDSNVIVWALNSKSAGNLRLFALRQGVLGQLNCPGSPRNVTISANGRLIAAGSTDSNVYVWNLRPAKTAGPFTGLGDDPNDVALSPDGRLVAACVFQQVMVWDINTGDVVARMPTSRSCYRIAFSHDSRRLLSAGMMNQVTLWDVEDGTEIKTLTGRNSNFAGNATAVRYLPDARGAVSTGTDGVIRVWRLPD